MNWVSLLLAFLLLFGCGSSSPSRDVEDGGTARDTPTGERRPTGDFSRRDKVVSPDGAFFDGRGNKDTAIGLKCIRWSEWNCKPSLPTDEIPMCEATCVLEDGTTVYRMYIIGDETMVSSCYRGDVPYETCGSHTYVGSDPCEMCEAALQAGCCKR